MDMNNKKQTILSVLSIVLASCSFFSVFLGFNVGVLGPIIGIIICLIAIVLGVNASHIDKSKALPKVGIWLSVSFAILNLVFCITCVTLCGGETGEKSIETTFNGCTEASCKSDKAKYGGYGFYYMNGFSSTDFSDYMVTKKRSKLVTLDHEPSLVIENEEDMPVMDGAEACYPLYAAVAKAVYKDIDKIESGKLSTEEENSNGKIVTFTNTIHAFRRLIKNDGYFDKVDLFFGAHPSTDQIRGAEAMDIELLITKIGSEAFVFFVEQDNPVDNLTSDQIRAIYHGDITNWKEVGGLDQEIVAFQRPENSGSQVVMHDFMGEISLKEAKTYEIKDAMGQVTKEVAQYYGEDGAMGYSFRYFLEELNQEEGIKILSVDGVYPSLENIENGSYGIVTDFCLVTRKDDPNPYVQKMIEFMLSEDGQYIVRQTGYAGISEAIDPTALTEIVDFPKFYSANGVELAVDMRRYSEDAKILTSNDIAIEIVDNCYVSHIKFDRIIIKNENGLSEARTKCMLEFPKDSKDWPYDWQNYKNYIRAFRELVRKYPISDYDYVLEYHPVYSNASWIRSAAALVVDKNIMDYVYEKDNRDLSNDFVTCDVDANMFFAAVPKGIISDEEYNGWVTYK